MNKSELIDAVAKSADLKKKDAEAAVKAVFEAIEGELAKGGKVQLMGFGTFSVKERKARTGRNPATGEAIKIKAAKLPAFAAGAGLKEKVAKAKKKAK